MRSVSYLPVLLLVTAMPQAQGRITTPKEHFGFTIGDDYVLANYTQLDQLLAEAGPASPTA